VGDRETEDLRPVPRLLHGGRAAGRLRLSARARAGRYTGYKARIARRRGMR
jgi:hypothetical protein